MKNLPRAFSVIPLFCVVCAAWIAASAAHAASAVIKGGAEAGSHSADIYRKEEEERRKSNSSSGSIVLVKADCTGFLCTVKKLCLSGGPGHIADRCSSTSFNSIHGNNVAGTYQYSIELSNRRVCAGSIRVSGAKRNVYIDVYENCADAGSYEH